MKRKLIATCKTEPLFLYSPIISETYSFSLLHIVQAIINHRRIKITMAQFHFETTPVLSIQNDSSWSIFSLAISYLSGKYRSHCLAKELARRKNCLLSVTACVAVLSDMAIGHSPFSAHNIYCSSIILINIPLCQISCPLRTVHFKMELR